MLATGRLYHVIFLSNNMFPLCLLTLLLSELKRTELWVFERVNWPVGPMHSVFVVQLTTRADTKTTVLWGRPENKPCTPDFPVHTR